MQTNRDQFKTVAVEFKQSTCSRVNSILCIGNSYITWSYFLHIRIWFIDSNEFIRYKYN